MPMPLWWGHVNKRIFNPREIAGGKRPVLTHIGRVSGTSHQTPLDAIPLDGGYLIMLVYGSKCDWVQNVLAAGRAQLSIAGSEIQLENPRIVGEDSLPTDASRPPKFLRISEYLRMDTAK